MIVYCVIRFFAWLMLSKGSNAGLKYTGFTEIDQTTLLLLQKQCEYELKIYHEYQCLLMCGYYFAAFDDITSYAFGFENDQSCCCMDIKKPTDTATSLQWNSETQVYMTENCGITLLILLGLLAC